MDQLKALWDKAVAWIKANTQLVYIIVAVVGAIFVLPKLYKKFFGRKYSHRRRVHHAIRTYARRRYSAGRGKGSLYMRRKMARLRNMRRHKRRPAYAA